MNPIRSPLEKMILFSHPTGNTYTRAALEALFEAGLLGEFHTCVATYHGNVWDVLSRLPAGRAFQRRRFDERLKTITVQHPLRELGRMFASRLRLSRLTRHETGTFCVDAAFQSLDQRIACRLQNESDFCARFSQFLISRRARDFSGVYAGEDGALASFEAAQNLGLRCYYDLPIAYWQTVRRLLQEEAARLPEWEPTLGGTRDSLAKLDRKTKELELADVVFCPSRFVADSIPKWARRNKQIVLAPFGSPPSGPPKPAVSASGARLRVLFAGSLSQRKGLGDLFAALRLLNRRDVELVVMGSLQAPLAFYRRAFPGFTYEPGRAHQQVLELMRSCDVLCLPSLVEGRALVMQEAMSQGLPLIITPNTGGEDLVEHGVTGFMVPVRQPNAIAEKIAWFADNRSQLPAMSRAAQSKAATFTWVAYGRTIVETIINTN